MSLRHLLRQLRLGAAAFFVSGVLLSPSFAQDGPNVTTLVATPTGRAALAAPTSLTALQAWASACIPATKYRALDVFAAVAGAATLSVQRYADPICSYAVGTALPSSALVLAQGAKCPGGAGTSYCGDVGSNDGLPFGALKVMLTDTSNATNAVTVVWLNQAAQ